jgi:hypothetical protein
MRSYATEVRTPPCTFVQSQESSRPGTKRSSASENMPASTSSGSDPLTRCSFELPLRSAGNLHSSRKRYVTTATDEIAARLGTRLGRNANGPPSLGVEPVMCRVVRCLSMLICFRCGTTSTQAYFPQWRPTATTQPSASRTSQPTFIACQLGVSSCIVCVAPRARTTSLTESFLASP